jgi:hypothetical protein
MSGVIAAAGITAAAGIGAGLMKSGSQSGAGPGAAPGTAVQTSEKSIPEWVYNAGMGNYNKAEQAADELMKPYGGPRVADLSPEQQDMIRRLYGNVGSGDAAYNQASGMYNGLVGFNSGQITPQTMAGKDLSPYMSPYTQQIIDPSLKLMEQSRRQAIGQIGDTAKQAGAFGGSRQGISEGVTNSQSALQQGQFGANLYNQNFMNAQQMATGDITRDIAAQTANMGARQYDAGFQGNLAGSIAGLADKRQANFLSGITAAMGGQDVDYQNRQAKLKAAQDLYGEQRQYPLDQLAIRQNALARTPYGQTSTTTGPGPSSDPWMTGLGTAATTAGLMGSLGKMGNIFGTKSSGYTTNDQMRATDAEIENWSNYANR